MASQGLGVRYNGGYDQPLDAAMWESGNSIYISTGDFSAAEVEAKLINMYKPQLNRRDHPVNPNLEIKHKNIIINKTISRVVSYKYSE